MKYNIIRSIWHTPGSGRVIGVVAIKSLNGDIWKWRAFIDVVRGLDESLDEQEVAQHGSPLCKKVAQGYFPELDIEDYKN